jgi:hypothetical protein
MSRACQNPRRGLTVPTSVVKYDDVRNIKAALKNVALDGYAKSEFLEINAPKIKESFEALAKVLPSENACYKRIAEILSLRSSGAKFHSGDIRKALALTAPPKPTPMRRKKTAKSEAKNQKQPLKD